MPTPSYEYEAWEYQITVDTTHTGSIIVIEDAGTPTAVNLPVGDYYPTEFRAALALALNNAAGLTGTYTVGVDTPTSSQLAGKQGLRVSATGLTTLAIGAASGANDTRPRPEDWMGWGAPGSSVTGIAEGSALVCVSPFTTVGVWVPREYRVSAERMPERIINGSSIYTERDDFYAVSRGKRSKRTYIYEQIPSTRILRGRGKRADYAAFGEIGVGDEGDAFEWLWERLSQGGAARVLWYGPNQALGTSGVPVEVVVMDGIDAGANMADLVRSQRLAAEVYAVTIPTAIVSTEVDY